MKHWHNEKKVVLRYFSSCFEISSPKSFSRTGAGVQDPTLDLWREAPRKASLFCYAMDRETVLYCPTFPQCWPMKRNYIVYQEIGRWHRKLKCRMIFTFPWTSLTRVTAPLRFVYVHKFAPNQWKWRVLSIDLNWNKSLQMHCLKLEYSTSV